MDKNRLNLWPVFFLLVLALPVEAGIYHDRFMTIEPGPYVVFLGRPLYPLAKDGRYALITEPNRYGSEAYPLVFKKVGKTWAEQSLLKPEDTSWLFVRDRDLGQLQGDWAVYPSYKEDASAAGSSFSLHIFKRDGDTWTEHQKIDANSMEAGFEIKAISLDGDRFAVAGYYELDGESGKTAAHVYRLENDAWVHDGKLEKQDFTHDNGADPAIYLSLSGDRVILGERWSDPQPPIYIFKREGNAWIQEVALTPSVSDVSGDVNPVYQVMLKDERAYAVIQDEDARQYYIHIFNREEGNWTEQAGIPCPEMDYTPRTYNGEISHYGISLVSDGNYLAVVSSSKELATSGRTYSHGSNIWLYQLIGEAWTLMGSFDYAYYSSSLVLDEGELLLRWGDTVCAYTIDPNQDLSQEDEEALEGFDTAYYLEQKLAHQQSVSPEWAGKTTAEYEAYLKGEGYTPESHYSQWGYTEGLEPNAWFNHSEYLLALSRYMVQQGIYPSVQDAMASLESAWPGDLYLHYLLWGYSFGINPSNSFDVSLYLEDKLAYLQAGGTWAGRTVSDLKTYYDNLEMSVLEDYVLRGEDEGLIPQAVPEGERADACATDLPFDSVEGLRGFDKEWYLSAKLAHQQSVSPGWEETTTEEYECYLKQAGYSALSHYTRWGYLEDLSPNPYFDHSEYLEIISQRLVDLGVYTSIEDAEASVRTAWPGDLYQHYLAWGAGEGLSPSYGFDESRYLSDRLSLLQAGGTWIGKSVDDLRTYFTAQGTTVLEDYLENGEALGLTPASVPEGERGDI